MPRLFYPPLAEPGVYIKPKGIQDKQWERVLSSDTLLIMTYSWLAESAFILRLMMIFWMNIHSTPSITAAAIEKTV